MASETLTAPVKKLVDFRLAILYFENIDFLVKIQECES